MSEFRVQKKKKVI